MKACLLWLGELKVKRGFFVLFWFLFVLLSSTCFAAFSLLFQVDDVITSFVGEWDLNYILIRENEEQNETGEVKQLIRELGYQTGYVNYTINPEDFGFFRYVQTDSMTDPKDTYGAAECYINGQNLRLTRMNERIIEGQGYYESEEMLIWVSDYAAKQKDIHVGDYLKTVEVEYPVEDDFILPSILVAGVYSFDESDRRMLFVLNEASLKAVFNPESEMGEIYSIYAPNYSTEKSIIEVLEDKGVNCTYEVSWNQEIIRIQYVVWVIVFCVVLLSAFVVFSLVRTYCNNRKRYYAMLSLLGNPWWANFGICCGTWMTMFLVAIPFGAILAIPFVNYINGILLGITEDANVHYRFWGGESLVVVVILILNIIISCALCLTKSHDDLTMYLREERE